MRALIPPAQRPLALIAPAQLSAAASAQRKKDQENLVQLKKAQLTAAAGAARPGPARGPPRCLSHPLHAQQSAPTGAFGDTYLHHFREA